MTFFRNSTKQSSIKLQISETASNVRSNLKLHAYPEEKLFPISNQQSNSVGLEKRDNDIFCADVIHNENNDVAIVNEGDNDAFHQTANNLLQGRLGITCAYDKSTNLLFVCGGVNPTKNELGSEAQGKNLYTVVSIKLVYAHFYHFTC